MVIDELKIGFFTKWAFESYLLDKSIHYFRTKEHFDRVMLNELRDTTDIIQQQLLMRIHEIFY